MAQTPLITTLLDSQNSPHHFVLKPSMIRAVNQADLIIWGGPALEASLAKLIKRLPRTKSIVSVFTIPNIKTYPTRDVIYAFSKPHQHEKDPHVWLDIDNAILIAQSIAKHAIKLDPKNRSLYTSNLKDFEQKLRKLDQTLQQQTKAYRNVPYLVFHDAFQYYEKRYGLSPVGTVYWEPDVPLSVQHIKKLQSIVTNKKISCLFYEPQYDITPVENIFSGLPIHTVMLDPIGNQKTHSFQDLLLKINQNMKTCLKP